VTPISHISTGTPLHIVVVFSSLIFLHQVYACLLGLVEPLQSVLEYGKVSVHMQICLSLPHLLLLIYYRFEQVPYRCVIREHHPGDLVRGLHIWRLLGQRHLDRGRPPGYKSSQFTLADPLQGFMYLGRVHLTLDNVQDRNIASFFYTGGDEDVFRL